MEQSSALGGNARSFSGRILGGLRTTTCMVAVGLVIVLLAVRKLFS